MTLHYAYTMEAVEMLHQSTNQTHYLLGIYHAFSPCLSLNSNMWWHFSWKLLILIIQFNFALSLRIQIAKRLHILMDKVQVVHVQVYYLNNFLCIEKKHIASWKHSDNKMSVGIFMLYDIIFEYQGYWLILNFY